jgi:hypothetical protein
MTSEHTNGQHKPAFDLGRYETKQQPITSAAQPRARKSKEKFVMVPESVLRDCNLTHSEFRLMAVLLAKRFAAKDKTAPIVCSDLAEYGLGRTAKHNALHGLERKGYITVEYCGNRAPRVLVSEVGGVPKSTPSRSETNMPVH